MVKSLKLDHELAQAVLGGTKTSTWRVNDDKDLHVNDDISLIDKVKSNDPASWQYMGVAHITSILEKPLGAIQSRDMEGSEKFTSTAETIETFRGYYGPQINEDTPVKMIRFSFTVSPPTDVASVARPEPALTTIKLFADGGSRGNPGPSACGYVILDMHDKIIVENGLYLGVTTNNQAEYQALKIGLEDALGRGVRQVDVYMDSMLVINQMKGIFKLKNQDLAPIHEAIKRLVTRFDKVSFTQVPRELNKLADAVVNRVLDTTGAS